MPSIKDLRSHFAVDVSLERDGAWVTFPGGMELKIRSHNSHKAQDFLAGLGKRQRQAIVSNGGNTPADLQESNDIALCSKVLVTDWRNVTGEDGQPLPCTPANVEQFVSGEMAPLRREILYLSRIDETFRQEQKNVEAMAENLGKSLTAPAV